MKVEFVVGTFIALILLFALTIVGLSNIQSTQAPNSTAYNVTKEGISAFETFSSFVPVFVILIVALFVIALIFFTVKHAKRGI